MELNNVWIMNVLLLATHIMDCILSMDLLHVESYVGVSLFIFKCSSNQIFGSVRHTPWKSSQMIKNLFSRVQCLMFFKPYPLEDYFCLYMSITFSAHKKALKKENPNKQNSSSIKNPLFWKHHVLDFKDIYLETLGIRTYTCVYLVSSCH